MRDRPLWIDYVFEDVLDAQNTTNREPKRKRGDPLPKWLAQRWSEGGNRAKEKHRQARKAKALAEAIKRQKARGAHHNTKAPHRIVDKIMRLMVEGEWYGLKALARAAGMGASEAGRAKQSLTANAWVTTAGCPGWQPDDMPAPHEIESGAVKEPKTLYRLNEAGLAEKKRVALLAQSDSAELVQLTQLGQQDAERGTGDTSFDENHAVNVLLG